MLEQDVLLPDELRVWISWSGFTIGRSEEMDKWCSIMRASIVFCGENRTRWQACCLEYTELSETDLHAKTQDRDVFKPPYRYATIYARADVYELHFTRKQSAPSYFHNIHLFFLSTEGISSPAPYSARFHKVDWSIKLVE